jgi:hypothetical protein
MDGGVEESDGERQMTTTTTTTTTETTRKDTHGKVMQLVLLFGIKTS